MLLLCRFLLTVKSSGQQTSPPAKGSETGVKSRYLRENGLEHIEVHSLVSGDVLDLDVRILRQCLTVKVHGVCVGILVQDDFQSVG